MPTIRRGLCILLAAEVILLGNGLPSDWAPVQSLPAGTRVRLQLARRNNSVRGAIVVASPNSVTLSMAGADREFASTEIARLYSVVPRRRTRAVMIGTAAGAGIGLAAGAGVYSRQDFVKSVIPVSGLIGAGLGACIGALAGMGTREALIFAAYPPPQTASPPRP